ncbi:PAS domain-containing protein [bacterium]|nr:PAS domain-containing protein [bacterium]
MNLSNSILLMTMLMLAFSWALTSIRRSLPSLQRFTGMLMFTGIALIATFVIIPLQEGVILNRGAERLHWVDPSAATIVIALAIVLAGVLDGLVTAVAVAVLAYFMNGSLSTVMLLPVLYSVAAGLVVRHFWGLHRDFISSRVLLLLGLALSLPQAILFYSHFHSAPNFEPKAMLASMAVIIVAYPTAALVIGNLVSQPFHQILLENQLLDTQERNRQMVKLAGNAIVNFNADLEVIDYNEEAERIFGYPRQYLIGRKYLGLLFPSYIWAGIETDAQRVMDGGQIREHEVQVVSRDGKETPMIWSFSRITNARDEPLGMMAIGQDISQRKRNELKLAENEERVRLALSGADLAMWDWNLATEEFVTNDRWADMLGYVPDVQDTDVASWDERIHPEDRDHVLACMEQHLSGETDSFEVEYRMRRRDGDYLWVLSRARVIQRNEEGQPLRMTGTLLDISQRVASEQERRRLERQLRYSQKMETIGTLAGGIAHDFNNILQAIMGYTTLGSTRLPDDHPVQHDLERVLSASDRARSLVDQMLVFSRQAQQSRALVDVEQLCREVLRILGPQLDPREDIEVALEIAPDSPQILADPTQIHQVVMNLVINALHAMKDGGGRLGISLRRLDSAAVDLEQTGLAELPAAWLELVVSDTGCGIDPKHLSRLFEPFFTTKSVEEGTGLGLSVVHGIVTNHGGAISVDSEPGQGSRFTVVMPVLGDLAS